MTLRDVSSPPALPDRRTIVTGLLAALGVAWSRPVAALQAGGVDATTLGLRADGSDMSGVLSAALKKAAGQGRPLVLPPGDFRITGVECPPAARIVGVPGATRLVARGLGPILVSRGPERLWLEGLDLVGDGGRSAQAFGLIDMAGVGQLRLQDIACSGAAHSAVRLQACGGLVSGLRVERVAETGLFALDSTGLTVRDAEIRECGNNGIQVWRSAKGEDGTIVEACRISRIRFDGGGDGPNGNGVSVFRAGGVLVRGNVIADCALTAIRNNGGSGVVMTGNTCRRLGEVAIFQEFAFDGGIVAENVVEDAMTGISITNLDHGGRVAACTGNVVRRLRRKVPPYGGAIDGGIGIMAEAEVSVAGNVIEAADLTGVSVGWGPYGRNVTVSGNVVKGADMGVRLSVVEGVSGVAITGNTFSDVRRGGVLGCEWDKVVTGDLAGPVPAPLPRPLPGIVIASNVVRPAG